MYIHKITQTVRQDPNCSAMHFYYDPLDESLLAQDYITI